LTSVDRRLRLATVFLVVLVDLLGFGIVLPLLPFYGSKFGAGALTIGLLYSVYSLSQLVFAPLWGGWSDRIGRRPIMLLSTFGAAASYILFAFSHSLTLLFVSRILAGIMGGNISAAQAYVADVTPPEDRTKGMGLIGAAFGIGFALGPAISSLLIRPDVASHISANPYALPGLFAAGLSMASFLLVVFKLPESLDKRLLNDPTRVRRDSVLSAAFWKTASSSKGLRRLFVCMAILGIGHSSLYSAFPLFCEKVLKLPAQDVGLLFVCMGSVAIVVQGGLIRVLVKRFSEKKLFIAGGLLFAAGMALIPVSQDKGQLTLALCLMGLGASLNGPTLISLISKSARPAEIGAMLGSAQGLSALGRVIGPAWGGWLFAMAPALPFWLTASLVCITIYIGFLI
jgi:MFS transporter, DHA1 family, tetracycline resistance protein